MLRSHILELAQNHPDSSLLLFMALEEIHPARSCEESLQQVRTNSKQKIINNNDNDSDDDDDMMMVMMIIIIIVVVII